MRVGQQFLLRDRIFVKTGPIQAVPDGSTEPQIFMRSAAIQPLSAQPRAKTVPQESSPDRVAIGEALERYHLFCLNLMATQRQPAAAESARKELKRLYLDLLHLLR